MSWLRSTGLRLLLAIGLGFALWIFVEYTLNPDRQVQFNDQTVTPRGLGPGLVIVDDNGLPNPALPSVAVTLQADRETFAAPGSNDIQAYVDLSGLGPADHVVPVGANVSLPGQQPDVVEIAPAFLPIRIEELITRTVSLTVELNGSVPFSFESGTAIITDEGQLVTRAQVAGPRNRVELVARTRVTANISGLTADYRSPRQVEAVSDRGQEIDGVTIEPSSVNVQVPIRSSVGLKRVPVVPRVVGEPASGYIVTDVSVAPQFVQLTGSSEPLSSVSSIETQGVDVSGASGTISRTVNLQQPPFDGLSFDKPVSATVTILIAPIERSFQVTLPASVQPVDVGAGLLASVNPQTVQVTLAGSASQLNALSSTPLEGVVSARDLPAGTHTIRPQFTLPEGITLARQPPMVTLFLRSPPTRTPEATPVPPTETPTEAPAPTPTETPTEAPVPTPTEDAGPFVSPTATPAS